MMTTSLYMELKQQRSIRTIMIVEDEEDILDVYSDFLKRKGYTIEVSAPTANEILRDYETYRPDLVIIDYRLPGSINGVEASEKILRSHPSARIIIMTAFDQVKKEIRESRFFNDKTVLVLIKPVQLSYLARLISSLQ
jgi:DNA-binding NtrC family response regulator